MSSLLLRNSHRNSHGVEAAITTCDPSTLTESSDLALHRKENFDAYGMGSYTDTHYKNL